MRPTGLRLVGTAPDKAGVLSFVFEGHRVEDQLGIESARIAVHSGQPPRAPIPGGFGLENVARLLSPSSTLAPTLMR